MSASCWILVMLVGIGIVLIVVVLVAFVFYAIVSVLLVLTAVIYIGVSDLNLLPLSLGRLSTLRTAFGGMLCA